MYFQFSWRGGIQTIDFCLSALHSVAVSIPRFQPCFCLPQLSPAVAIVNSLRQGCYQVGRAILTSTQWVYHPLILQGDNKVIMFQRKPFALVLLRKLSLVFPDTLWVPSCLMDLPISSYLSHYPALLICLFKCRFVYMGACGHRVCVCVFNLSLPCPI